MANDLASKCRSFYKPYCALDGLARESNPYGNPMQRILLCSILKLSSLCAAALLVDSANVWAADGAENSRVIYAFNRQNQDNSGNDIDKTSSETEMRTVLQSSPAYPPIRESAEAQPQRLPPAPHRSSPMSLDTAVQPVSDSVEVDSTTRDGRHLAPPAQPLTSLGTATEDNKLSLPRLFKLPQLKSLGTAGAGLAVVVGLFLVCAVLVKHSRGKANSVLPQEAVATLGRISLTAKHTAHLLQVGSKLVLVAISAEGIQKITEVTEPSEVDRLLGICMKSHKQSTTAEFQRVLQELSQEPARGFLGSDASPFARAA